MNANQFDDVSLRVNYFNGQRLAAGDFRAEQGYHLGMRRVLNRSLYSSGIVVGMEVEPAKSNPVDPADKHRVVVRRGLSFDHLGREIFLPTDVVVQVMGAPSATPGVVFGNLLTISYRESRKFPAQDKCVIGLPYKPCSGDLAWGAPTRIAADAVFEFLDSWPAADSGRVVLAQIELSKQCNVVRVLSGVRKYAVPVKPPAVTPLALEGEKDIDINNPKELIFHVRGGFPSAATLVMRSRPFSSLHYSELAGHTHDLTLELSTQPGINAHKHTLGELKTDKKLHPDTIEFESLVHFGDPDDYCIRLWDDANGAQPTNLTPLSRFKARNTEHDHAIAAGTTTDEAGAVPSHTHTFTTKILGGAGQSPGSMRPGAAYTFFGDLKVEIDGVNVTEDILAQLKASGTDWPTLRLGTIGDQNHVMVTAGTDDIDLLRLPGVDLVPGPHTLKFTPQAGGGQLHYNLYVE
jgi:hypothetical protein